MAYRLGLLTTLEHNIGDDFIREGLLHVLAQLDPRPGALVTINKHLPFTAYPRWHPVRLAHVAGAALPSGLAWRSLRLAREFTRRIGGSRFQSCDLIIQCGTPVFWPDCRTSEWALLVWSDIFARLNSRIPVLNLGGGACYPWERQPETLVDTPDEAFVRLMLGAASLTTVRDPLARRLCASLGVAVQQLPCPALLAGQAHAAPAPADSRRVIVNYMPGGGHYDWGQTVDPAQWEQAMQAVVRHLRRDWDPMLICHNPTEERAAAQLWPDLPRITPGNVASYFAAVRDAAFGICNRMHSGVGLGGLGIPSVCIGTDTRNLMVASIGLPTLFIKEATSERLIDEIDALIARRALEHERLLALRHETLAAYVGLLRPWVERMRAR